MANVPILHAFIWATYGQAKRFIGKSLGQGEFSLFCFERKKQREEVGLILNSLGFPY
jgi:hypothetical protein